MTIGIKYMAWVNEMALPHHQFPTSYTIHFHDLPENCEAVKIYFMQFAISVKIHYLIAVGMKKGICKVMNAASTQKQPIASCKKGVALCKMASMKNLWNTGGSQEMAAMVGQWQTI